MRRGYQNNYSEDGGKLYWSDRRLHRLDALLCLTAALTLLGGHWLTGSCLILGVLILKVCYRLEPPQPHWQRNRFLLCAAALILFVSSLFGMRWQEEKLGPRIPWQDLTLSQNLPEPPSIRGRVRQDRWDELSLELFQITEAKARLYEQSCAAFGYEPGEADDQHWTGTAPDGSHLTLTHDPETEILLLTLQLSQPPHSGDPTKITLPTAPENLDAIHSWMKDQN